jgi:hypothetical protein
MIETLDPLSCVGFFKYLFFSLPKKLGKLCQCFSKRPFSLSL